MKRQLLLLMSRALLFALSVSCSASTFAQTEASVHEPIIKQKATEQMPIELTITNVAYAVDLNVVTLNSDFLYNQVKPAPVVQSVCLPAKTSNSLYGLAALTWCNYTIFSTQLPVLSFNYIEGIATEYRC